MPKKVTTQDWINKVESIHPNKFTFEKTRYTGQQNPITITCKIHGDISVVPKDVTVKKRGCRYCAGYVPTDISWTQENVRKWYVYEPETGLFKVRATGRILGTESNGYLVINMQGKVRALHRLIYFYMTDKQPEIIDHLDRNRTNNKWENLRAGDYYVNNHNIAAEGVVKNKGGTFTSRVMHFGKYHYLGVFDTYEEAREKSQEFYKDRIENNLYDKVNS